MIDELREEYSTADFKKEQAVRGKYFDALKDESNIIVLDPEVAKVFKNDKDVNEALLALIHLAKRSATANIY